MANGTKKAAKNPKKEIKSGKKIPRKFINTLPHEEEGIGPKKHQQGEASIPISQNVSPSSSFREFIERGKGKIQQSGKSLLKTFQKQYASGLPDEAVIKEDKKVYFPRIFRFITETRLLFVLLVVVFLSGSGILLLTIPGKIKQRTALEEKRSAIQQQIIYWQEISKKYKGYRDAYFQLALLEYQLGDFQSSQEYLNTVEMLDPNFEKAYQLEKLLEK